MKTYFNLLLISSGFTLLVHLIFSLYIGCFDRVAIINLIYILFEFFIFFSLLRFSLNNLNVNIVLLNSLYLKIIFLFISFFYLYYFNGAFFQHQFLGDDREYYHLATIYCCNLGDLIKENKSFYGLPFAIVLTSFNSILPSIELYRFINLIFSLISVYLFFLTLKNLFEDIKLILFVTLLYGFNIIVAIFSSLFYKDIFLLMIFSLYIYILSKNKNSFKDYIILSVVIFISFYFRYFLGFLELFIFGIFMLTKKLSLIKKILLVFFVILLLGIFIFIFKEKIMAILSIFDMFNTRIASVSSLFSKNIELSFSKLLIAASFFLDVAPMNIIHYNTQWYVIEGLVGFGRIINSVIAVFMYIGIYIILFKRKIFKIDRKIYLYLLIIFLMIFGMSITGQVLVDRQKIMIYPIVYLFVYIALEYGKSYKNNFLNLFYIIFFIKLCIQIVYVYIRSKMYV